MSFLPSKRLRPESTYNAISLFKQYCRPTAEPHGPKMSLVIFRACRRRSLAHIARGHCGRARRGRDTEIVPGQPVRYNWKVVCRGKLIPGFSDRIHPISERKKFFPIRKKSHVHCPVGEVVLDIVQFMQKVAPVGV